VALSSRKRHPAELQEVDTNSGTALTAGLPDMPLFIEIIHHFELADDLVPNHTASTADRCRREYAKEVVKLERRTPGLSATLSGRPLLNQMLFCRALLEQIR